jgi:Glycosyltransferase
LSKEILTIHDILFLDYPGLFPSSYRIRNKFFFSRSAARADFLLTVSEYSKKKISEHFKIKEQNIHVIPDGIADDFFKPPESAYDLKAIYGIGKYLLYVSRIEPRKNHLLLVKAFTELKLWNDDYTLVFIGSKALPTEELDNYLLSLPDDIKNKILFIDGAYGDRLKSFYRNCSLFVYPSLAEGFGIPPLEAIASGVPVLCSDSTAMGEFSFLRDRLFNPDSVNDLKEKIIKYLDNGENDFTEDIEHVRKNYSWKNSANIFSNIIFKH